MHCILKWLEGDDKTLCPMCKRKWGKLGVVGSREHPFTMVRNEPLIFHLTFFILMHSQSLRRNAHIRQNWMLRRKQRLNNDKDSSSSSQDSNSRKLLLDDATPFITLVADACHCTYITLLWQSHYVTLLLGICITEVLLF